MIYCNGRWSGRMQCRTSTERAGHGGDPSFRPRGADPGRELCVVRAGFAARPDLRRPAPVGAERRLARWWLSLAAVAIGGTGIWTMHFVAMLGFSVVGTPIRYDVGLTAASALIAVVGGGRRARASRCSAQARRLRILIGGCSPARRGRDALHRHGRDAPQRRDRIRARPGRRLGRRSRSSRRPRAVARGHRHSARCDLRLGAGHGCRRQRHALHRHVRHVGDQHAVGVPAGASATSLLVPIGVAWCSASSV